MLVLLKRNTFALKHVLIFGLICCGLLAPAQNRLMSHVTPLGGDFSTTFFFINPTEVTQSFELVPYALDGSSLPITSMDLPALSTEEIDTASLFSVTNVSHFQLVGGEAVEVVIAYRRTGNNNSSAHLALKGTTSPRWRVHPAELDDAVDGFAVVNLHTETRDIYIRQLSADGSELDRMSPFTLDSYGKGLTTLSSFERVAGAYFEIFAEGELGLTALRFPRPSDDYFWETAAIALPALIETANVVPEIMGQFVLTVTAGNALTITLDDLIVSDPDDDYPASFTLLVADGPNYSRSGNTITPAEGFTGVLSVPVTVNDGEDTSEVFTLQVTVAAAADPRIGTSVTFPVNSSYGVSGRAVIVDEHTIRLENFNYDGSGPDVRIYLGEVGNFANGIGITNQLGSLSNATMDISLPAGVSLDDFTGISVWCTLFLVDFSSGTFQ